MKALGRIIGILLLLVVVVGGAGFFLLPKVATKTETVDIPKPAATVYALLANTPVAGETIGEGVTQKFKTATPPDTVVFDLAYADGTTGEATYRVAAAGDKASKVTVTLTKPVTDDPMQRISALSGEPAAPVLASATQSLKTNADQLNGEPLTGLAYEVVTVTPQPYVFTVGASPQAPAEIKEAVGQALSLVDVLVKRTGAQIDGAPIAVETAWENDTYSFTAGWRIKGTAPRIYAGGVQVGQSPGGTAIKVVYRGTEEQVIPTYDKMEDLVLAAHQKLGQSFEVYHDDPTKPGGSVDREIFYLVEGTPEDVGAALAKILAPTPSAPALVPATAPLATTPATP